MVRRSLMRLAPVASLLFITALSVLSAPVVQAAVVTKVETDALAPLRDGKSRHIRLDSLPLYDSARSVVELEEFDVWAPGGKVVVHSPTGVVKLNPSPMRFYRGRVNADSESFAYFSVDLKTQHVDGLITTRDRRYAVSSARRPAGAPRGRHQDFDDFLTEVDQTDYIPGDMEAWQCAVDKVKLRAPDEEPAERDVRVDATPGLVARPQGITGTQSYAMTIGVETDNAFFVNAGSNLTTAENYIINLTGALATIYKRDLNIEARLSYVSVYTTNGVDPWDATDSFTGLNEIGDQYHDNILNAVSGAATLRTTSAVVMLSGEEYGGGVAWEGVIGRDDFFQGGHWGGPYSWCGGIGRLFGTTTIGTIPDPDATNTQGTLYGLPSGIQKYWPLVEYAHELGHTLAGHHTHCSAVSDAERIGSGFTDGSPASSASNQIDHCYGAEGLTSCFSGSSYVAGSQSIFKGTIMSYCHNVFQTSVPQSRFIFGVAGEPSAHELDDYLLRATGPVQFPGGDGRDGGSKNIVNAVGAFTATLNLPATVIQDSTGNIASVTAVPATGATYFWKITNGTITGGDGTSSITFTAGNAGTVGLTAMAYTEKRVGISESGEVTIEAAAVDTPANVVATPTGATAVQVTWSAATGATTYDVLRSSGGGVFAEVMTSLIDLTFTDTTAAANTSYLYAVRAHGAGAVVSDLSVPDLATTATFTDPTLTTTVTKMKAVHLTELLTAVNSLRTLAGLTAVSFTLPTPAAAVSIRRQHILDLRTGLDAARAALTLPALVYTDATITAGATTVKAAHVNELRAGVN
jgi:hypothetical protein